MWMWWCQSANCVLKHYSERLSHVKSTTHSLMHKGHKLISPFQWPFILVGLLKWTLQVLMYNMFTIFCSKWTHDSNSATSFDLMREDLSSCIFACLRQAQNECNQTQQRCHACIRFMFKALSDDKLLLINDCIYFIYNYSHDVLFYALLDLRVSCCKCKLSTCHMSCTAFIRS